MVVALGGLLQEHVWEHRLRRKTNDLLIMRSGAVNPCLESTRHCLLAAAYPFYHLRPACTRGGELVTYFELRNQDANQLVIAGREASNVRVKYIVYSKHVASLRPLISLARKSLGARPFVVV